VELAKKSELISGEAYWYKMVGQTPTITIEAQSAASFPLLTGVSKALNPGWNTFANPYLFSLSLEHLQSLNGPEDLIVYHFLKEDKYSEIKSEGTIDPWKGYIIWNGVEGKKLLSNLKIQAFSPDMKIIIPANKKAVSNDENEITLSLSSGTWENGDLSISYNTPGARQGRDKWDLPKPGLLNSNISIGLNVPWSHTDYLTDRRGNLGEGQCWKFITRSSVKNQDMRISTNWSLRYRTGGVAPDVYEDQINQPEKRAVLLDEAGGTVTWIPGLTKQDYLFKSSDSRINEFELLIGSDAYLKQKVESFKKVIRSFNLGQNFPNPFDDVTQINYQIPAQSKESQRNVSLNIYNLKGAWVKKLLDKKQASGKYIIYWDSRDYQGNALPSGTYFYQLKIGGDFSDQKKLVILR